MSKVIARVIVTPKPVVNDPQGITVRQGLSALGFAEVSDVRIGKYIEVSLDASSEHEARGRVEAMCNQLLANHVIEDFRFEIHMEAPHEISDFAGTPRAASRTVKDK
jgi:phosphoribosylformylglycinamidine synthase